MLNINDLIDALDAVAIKSVATDAYTSQVFQEAWLSWFEVLSEDVLQAGSIEIFQLHRQHYRNFGLVNSSYEFPIEFDKTTLREARRAKEQFFDVDITRLSRDAFDERLSVYEFFYQIIEKLSDGWNQLTKKKFRLSESVSETHVMIVLESIFDGTPKRDYPTNYSYVDRKGKRYHFPINTFSCGSLYLDVAKPSSLDEKMYYETTCEMALNAVALQLIASKVKRSDEFLRYTSAIEADL